MGKTREKGDRKETREGMGKPVTEERKKGGERKSDEGEEKANGTFP